jgi:hypothetical protein
MSKIYSLPLRRRKAHAHGDFMVAVTNAVLSAQLDGRAPPPHPNILATICECFPAADEATAEPKTRGGAS